MLQLPAFVSPCSPSFTSTRPYRCSPPTRAHARACRSPIDHAEIVAIRAASAKLKDVKRPLDGTNGGLGEDFAGFTIYLLTAPCPMCMAAMHLCGPDALVYGTTRDEYGSFFRTDRRYFKRE